MKDYVAILIEDWNGGVADQTKYREQVIAANAPPVAIFGRLKPETRCYTYLAARGNAYSDGNGYSLKVERYFTTKPVPAPPPTPVPKPEPTPDNGIEEVVRLPEEKEILAKQEPIYVEVVKDGTVYGNTDGLTSTFNVAEGSSGVHAVPIQVRLTGSPSAAVNLRVKFHKPNDTEVRGRKNAGANRDFYFQ